MPIDGILLNKIVEEMNDVTPLKINRITQPSPHDFMIWGYAGKKYNILISTHPNFSRIQLTQDKDSFNVEGNHFLLLLRKHLSGGIVESISQYNGDRVVELAINHRDEMGVIRPYRLIVELLGKYANIILVNEDNIILDAHKRIMSFESENRSITSGSVYEYPPQNNRVPISESSAYDPEVSLMHTFMGVSPTLEKEFIHRLSSQSFEEITELLNNNQLYVYSKDYHLLPLTHIKETPKVFPLMQGLEYFYKEKQDSDRIKNFTGDIKKVLKREIKRTKSKLPKLIADMEKAQDYAKYQEYGDLLFAYATHLPSGNKEITLQNFDNEEVTIPLDIRYDGKTNAKRYFKQYQKTKTSIRYLEEQIDITSNRLAYFEKTLDQLELARIEDALEIKEELIAQKIIKKPSKMKVNTKKPKFETFVMDDNTTIYFGRNNLQNEYVSFKLARNEDTWFHAANTSGSHVLIKTDELNEEKIRLCAHIAAYFSKARLGSSVEVHYTSPQNIKKIPGALPGTIRMSSHRSIFIDPEEEILKSYGVL